MSEPRDRAARRALPCRGARSIPKRSRSSTGCSRGISPPTSWAAASATCCWAASPRTSTSAPRRIPTRSRSSFATAGSSDGGSAWRTCASATRRSRWPRSGAGARGRSARAGYAEAMAAEPPRRRRSRHPRPSPKRRKKRWTRPRRSIACCIVTTPSARPKQDAFRRDFTINALFYDIATFSIIDYTGRPGRPARGRDPVDRRSDGALPGRSGADAARRRRSRPAWTSPSTRRWKRRLRRGATTSRAAPRRG